MINYKDNSNYDILCTALYQERENLFKLIKEGYRMKEKA